MTKIVTFGISTKSHGLMLAMEVAHFANIRQFVMSLCKIRYSPTLIASLFNIAYNLYICLGNHDLSDRIFRTFTIKSVLYGGSAFEIF